MVQQGTGSTILPLDDDLVTLIDHLDDATHTERPCTGKIARAYANLAYMRGYCDANARPFEHRAFRCWRELRIRDQAVLSGLERSIAASEDEDALRQAWIGWLTARVNEAAGFAACEDYRRRAADHLEDAETAQGRVLDRLRLRASASTPAPIALFSAMSRVDSAATRTKLMRAWREARVESLGAVVSLIDRTLAIRRDHVRRCGFASVLDHTLSRGGIGELEIKSFLERYAGVALDEHQELSARVAADVGDLETPLIHFPRYLAVKAKGASIPAFELESCLEFLLATFAEHLAVRGQYRWRGNVLDIVISQGGRRCGLITIDTSEGGFAPAPIAHNEPWARVLRRTQKDSRGREVMSFDAVQSLFHEIGHALGYVLTDRPCPSASCVDCLPAERLEQLSTWSELWVFHKDLGARLNVKDGLLARCRMIRAMEFIRGRLERVATAILDFELHRSNDRGLQNVFDVLAHSNPCIFVFSLADLAHHFVTLSFADNAGASFAYLWGGAVAAEAHRIEQQSAIAAHATGRRILSGEVGTPAIAPVFEFYRSHAQWGGM